MPAEEYLRLGLDDDLSGPLSKTIKKLDATDASMVAVRKKVEQLTGSLKDNSFAYEETTQKYVDAQRKLAEYGATAEQQSYILNRAADAAGRYGLSVEKAAIVVEELATDLQDSNQVLMHQDAALRFVANSHLRAEDALGQYVDMTKGGTQALREYGERASRVAAEIDKIEDPTIRAKEAFKALEREQRRAAKGGDLYSKAMDKLAIGQSKIAAAGPPVQMVIQAAIAGYAALGAATVGFALSSIPVYLKSSGDTMIATDNLSKSFQQLQESMGQAMLGPPEEAAEKVDRLTAALNRLDRKVKENDEEIGDFVDGTLILLEHAFTTLSFTTSVALTPLALLHDLFKGIAAVGVTLTGVIAEDLSEGLAGLGLISDETAASMKQWGTETVEYGDSMNLLTDDLWKGWDAASDFAEELARGSDALKLAKDNTVDFNSELIDLTFTLEKLAEMSDLDFLAEVSSADVGPLADATGSAKKKVSRRRRGGKKKKEPSFEETYEAGGFGGDLTSDAFAGPSDADIALGDLILERKKAADAAAETLGDPKLQEALNAALEAVSGIQGEFQRIQEEQHSFAYNLEQSLPRAVNAWAEAFDILEDAATGAMGSIEAGIAAVSGALVKGENVGSAFGKAMLMAFGSTLQQMGAGYIALGGTMVATGNYAGGAAVIAGGAALVGIGASMQAGASLLGGGAKSAKRTKSRAESSSPSAAFAGGGFGGDQAVNLQVNLKVADQSFDDAVQTSVSRNRESNR